MIFSGRRTQFSTLRKMEKIIIENRVRDDEMEDECRSEGEEFLAVATTRIQRRTALQI